MNLDINRTKHQQDQRQDENAVTIIVLKTLFVRVQFSQVDIYSRAQAWIYLKGNHVCQTEYIRGRANKCYVSRQNYNSLDMWMHELIHERMNYINALINSRINSQINELREYSIKYMVNELIYIIIC